MLMTSLKNGQGYSPLPIFVPLTSVFDFNFFQDTFFLEVIVFVFLFNQLGC